MRGVFWAKLIDPRQVLDRLPPRYGRVFADHVTLRAKTELTPDLERLLGTRTRAHVRAEAWNEEIQAAEVELEPAIAALCQNAHPHITLSSDGAPPVGSNAMLASRHAETPCDFWVDLALEFRAFR